MSAFPIPIQGVELERAQPSRSYRLDWDSGRILPVGSIDGLDAIHQAIKKVLLTPRFRCLIYDNQYGSELKQVIIADDATPEFIETEIPQMARDALLVDSRIRQVSDFFISFEADKAHIRFTAETALGRVDISEVI